MSELRRIQFDTVKAPFEELAALDRLVHEPARLSILTALASRPGC